MLTFYLVIFPALAPAAAGYSSDESATTSYPLALIKSSANMISVPVKKNVEISDIKNTCGLEKLKNNYIYHWDTKTGTWGSPDVLEPDKGYLVIPAEDCTIYFEGPAKPETMKIQLLPGWNMVSGSGSIGDIIGDCGGKFDAALKLDARTQKYESVVVLEPDNGYWVYVNSKDGCTLGGQDVTTISGSGRTEKKTFYSKSLERVMAVNVYLPPGYDYSNKKYPVLYLFAGAEPSTEDSWTNLGNIDKTADSMIKEGAIQEMIIVMPDTDGTTLQNGCSIAGISVSAIRRCGNYEDYIVKDLVPFIDSDYKTIPDKYHRGTDGNSNGATGAIYMVINHPEMFFSGAGHSGVYSGLRVPEGLTGISLYMDVGMFDPFKNTGVAFASKLKKSKIEYTFNTFRDLGVLSAPLGHHGWKYWQKYVKRSLEFTSNNFAAGADASCKC